MTDELIIPSESVLMGVHEKILKVMENVSYLQADDSVKYDGKKQYDYLSEEKITKVLHEQFVKVGLIVFPCRTKVTPVFEERITEDKTKGVIITEKRNVKTIVEVTYKIVDPLTGSYEFIMVCGKGSDTQDKDTNKAMTGAFKYMQRQTFMLSSGDDPDKISSADMDNLVKDTFNATVVVGDGDKVEEKKTEVTIEPDKEIQELINTSKSPAVAKKLAEAFKGSKEDLVKLLKERQ